MTEPVPTARDYAQASLRDLGSHYLDLLDTDVRARLSGRPSHRARRVVDVEVPQCRPRIP